MHKGPRASSPNSVIAAWIDCPAGLQAPHFRPGQHPTHLEAPREVIGACPRRGSSGRSDRKDPDPPRASLPQPSNQRSELQGIEDNIAPSAPDPAHLTSTSHHPRSLDPVPKHTPQPAHLAPEELLFSHYLQLVRQDLSDPTMAEPPGWTPKGMAAVFITLCPTLDPLNFLSIYKAASSVLPTVAKYNWLIIAPFLWSVRLLLLHTNILVTLLVAVLGFLIMIAAEQAAAAQLKREEERGSSLIIGKSRHHALDAFASASQPAASAGPSRSAPRSAAPEVATATAHASRGMPPSSRPKEDPALQQARALVIKLESALYGNELSDGLLPADQLPVFTQKLCEEVGMKFRPGGSVAEMQHALNEVQKIVGV